MIFVSELSVILLSLLLVSTSSPDPAIPRSHARLSVSLKGYPTLTSTPKTFMTTSTKTTTSADTPKDLNHSKKARVWRTKRSSSSKNMKPPLLLQIPLDKDKLLQLIRNQKRKLKISPPSSESGDINPCQIFVAIDSKIVVQSPCLNGGECLGIDDRSFDCYCPEEFTGPACEFRNACYRSPCLNGGTCQSIEDSGVCNCLYGFKGLYCEEDTIPNDPYRRFGINGFKPEESKSNSRVNGKVTKDPCTDQTSSETKDKLCVNGGTCVVPSLTRNSYECECPKEYTGSFCQFSNACANSPCKNGATCTSFEDSGVCECPLGFTGAYCQEIDDMTILLRKSRRWNGGGRSNYEYQISTRTLPTTTLQVEVSTTLITTQISTSTSTTEAPETSTVQPCDRKDSDGTLPCKNNGKCIVLDELSFECECSRRYTGEFCQFLDLCYNSPCKNNGICEAFDGAAVCNCPVGATGVYCEIVEKPVKKSGLDDLKQLLLPSDKERAKKSISSHSQNTPGIDLCKIQEDKAEGCLNGGSCIGVKDKKVECRCPNEYTGNFCEFSNACSKSPCLNGGTCLSFEDSGVCTCPPRFTGTYCEIIDDSTNSPIVAEILSRKFLPEGKVIFSPDFDHCHNTDKDVDQKPRCQNGGRCILLDEEAYGCECREGFIGIFCEYKDMCYSSPCQNGGSCESFEHSGICNCPDGYKGAYCQFETDIFKIQPGSLSHADNQNAERTLSEELDYLDVLTNSYRSRFPKGTPYPVHLQMQPKPQALVKAVVEPMNSEQQQSETIKDPVVSIPGFEDITKDMIRTAQDGTIYIRKPKKLKLQQPLESNSSVTAQPNSPSQIVSQSREPMPLSIEGRTLNASIVKVMPNGEVFIKVLVPKRPRKTPIALDLDDLFDKEEK